MTYHIMDHQEITFETINEKELFKIGKIIGVSFHHTAHREIIKNTLILRNKYDDTLKIIKFINDSGRKDIDSFLFKLKKEVINYIKKQEYYKNINVKQWNIEKNELLKKVKCNRVKSYAIWDSDGKYFLSLDIKSANFTVLKELAKGTIKENNFPDFLRNCYPRDVRSNSNKNTEKAVSGITTEIPDVIYDSKYIRVFILSDLPLQALWEIKNYGLLLEICKLNLENPICVNSDEIVIEVENCDEADKIAKLLPLDDTFRVRKFQLTKIEGYEKNCMLKTYSDMTKVLVNAHPDHYDELYKNLILNPNTTLT